MLNYFKKIFLLVLVLGLSGLGVLAGQFVTKNLMVSTLAHASEDKGSLALTKERRERYQNLELFQKVLHFVETNYVDEVKHTELVEGAIKGMMDTLDPHSNFLSTEIYKDMKIDTSGKFGGLGIEIGIRDNVLTVVAPIEDTPAWKAGLKPRDRIVKINGESTKGMSLTEAVSKMRGKKGTECLLTIYRKGFEKIKDVGIVRGTIKIKAVKYEELEPSYGYVRLTTFNEGASKDMVKAIKKLEKKSKLKGLVFDMRTTPGGLLDQAIEISSLFLKQGVIVSTVGRDENRKDVKHVRKGKSRTDFNVAILVDSSTASAAEIVAGALQDHSRAIVMGQPTFGKGSVQTVIDLGRDMGLKLTIARYYTPSGRSIQEKGVMPDILLDEYDPKLLKKAKLTQEGIREKDLEGHLAGKKKGKKLEDFSFNELKKIGKKKKGDEEEEESDDMTPFRFEPKTDYQVQQALKHLKSYEIFKKIADAKKPVKGLSVKTQ